jgi:hypothetical protein
LIYDQQVVGGAIHALHRLSRILARFTDNLGFTHKLLKYLRPDSFGNHVITLIGGEKKEGDFTVPLCGPETVLTNFDELFL